MEFYFVIREMKKIVAMVLMIGMCLGGISLADSPIQEHVYPFSVYSLPVLREVYRLPQLLGNIPYVYTQISHLLLENQHMSPDEASVYSLESDEIFVYLKKSPSFDEFYRQVRVGIIEYLLDHHYTNFFSRPYHREINSALTVESGNFVVQDIIEEKDDLDVLLESKLAEYAKNFSSLKSYLDDLDFAAIVFSEEELSQLTTLYLFKTQQDLYDLGYELVSRKSRINTDVDYRRHNIMAAFHNIGTVRLLMPGQIFSTLKEIHYSAKRGWGYEYQEGLVTVGDGAVMLYGGGLCGVATALFQGSLTNQGLSLIEYKPHSTYYRNLYEADINGIEITDPGLDATIFSPVFDLKLKNIREYPIVLGFAFDGLSGSTEQVFTLAKAQDKGTFSFVRSYMRGSDSCFVWKINGKNLTNCYRHVKNY